MRAKHEGTLNDADPMVLTACGDKRPCGRHRKVNIAFICVHQRPKIQL